MPSVRVRWVRVDGYRIRVLTAGSGKKDAVVLPGMSASYQTLAPQIRLLRRLGYVTHVIELPGTSCGPALRREHATFAQLAAQTARVLDHIGVGHALLVGHSLGGGIALHLALSRRDLVERLVLIAPAGLGRSLLWTYKLMCVPLVGRALMRPIPIASASYLRNVLLGSKRRDDARFIARLLRMERPSVAKTLTMRAIVWANAPRRLRKVAYLFLPGGEQCTFSVRSRLGELRDLPMLVLWGAQDRVICARDAAACASAELRAEVHVRAGAGHMLPLEDAAWTAARIQSFLASDALTRAA
jgi:pimeloyl-ACP methyl ester carboxylesterase